MIENPVVLETKKPSHSEFKEERTSTFLILTKSDIERRKRMFGDEDEE